MRRSSLIRDRRGIVLDTITIAVVALTMALAMGGWIFGVSSVFVKGGRIEIKAVYAMRNGNSFTIFVETSNMGSAASTIEDVLLNNVRYESPELPLTVLTGHNVVIKLVVPISQGIQSGLMVQVCLQTTDRISVNTVVVLP